jgi:hypothetical protein
MRDLSGYAIAMMFAMCMALPIPVLGQNAQTPPALGIQPKPDGTPVPRTQDGRAACLESGTKDLLRTQRPVWSRCRSRPRD